MQRAAEQLTGFTTGALTADEYRHLLLAAGFTWITITATHDAVSGLRSAIIQAARPVAPARGADPAHATSRRQRCPGDPPGWPGQRPG
jgi:hypothetical protein